MRKKQNRVRCDEEKFLKAVFSSTTYHEVAEKTGQKITSTIARYNRTKKILSEKGIEFPVLKKQAQNMTHTVEIINRLKKYHKGV